MDLRSAADMVKFLIEQMIPLVKCEERQSPSVAFPCWAILVLFAFSHLATPFPFQYSQIELSYDAG